MVICLSWWWKGPDIYKTGSDISIDKMLKYRKKCVAEKCLYLLYQHFLSGCHMPGSMQGPGEPKSTEAYFLYLRWVSQRWHPSLFRRKSIWSGKCYMKTQSSGNSRVERSILCEGMGPGFHPSVCMSMYVCAHVQCVHSYVCATVRGWYGWELRCVWSNHKAELLTVIH